MAVATGLIGAGNIAQHAHLPAFREFSEEVPLRAVCDLREDVVRETAEEFDAEYWTDYESFLDEAPIDAVVIVLPHHLHYPVTRAALEAGKHVLLEKPFATSLADCIELVELADDADRTLMVAQKQRFVPSYQAVKRRIEEGALGQIHHARIDAIQNLPGMGDAYAPPHWLYDGEKAGGGSIISVLVHKIDLLRYLLGDVRRATALGKTTHPAFDDAEDHAVGLLEFENGAHVDFFNTYTAAGVPYDEMFWLFGEDGVIHTLPGEQGGEEYVGEPLPWIRRRDDEGSRKTFRAIDPDPGEVGLHTDAPFANQLRHFADCVRNGREPLSSGRDNLGTMAAIFALYESMDRGGEPVLVEDVIDDANGR